MIKNCEVLNDGLEIIQFIKSNLYVVDRYICTINNNEDLNSNALPLIKYNYLSGKSVKISNIT